ncbi:hypothetical protein HY312_00530 [Candidatus Saccharibacteria bacterium]|nr:hypothetical protein [Candidatus Saccharibacteria bacterium]
MSNKLHLSKEQQDAHLAMWEDQFDMQADETLPSNQASAFSEAITEEVDENDPLEAYTKESARVIDWTAEKVAGNGDSKLRTFVANKLYDKAASVDDREGNYKSRSIDRVNNGIDTAKYMLAAAHDAKERRKNRVKKQHFRTIGRKLVAYHTAGREAAKNMNKKETLPPKEVTQKDFELVG